MDMQGPPKCVKRSCPDCFPSHVSYQNIQNFFRKTPIQMQELWKVWHLYKALGACWHLRT